MTKGAIGRMTGKVNTMRIRSLLLASTTLALTSAFDNETGWKMDGDKLATDANGDPIYIDSSGREASIKHDSIATRNGEAKTQRERAEKAEKDLEKFKVEGKLIDPAVAIKAIDTVKKYEAKQLIDAGEVDKVREEISGQFREQLTEAQKQAQDWQGKYENKLVDDVFNSDFMENVAMPKDFFSAAMRSNFKVEDGKIVAYDRTGNRLMSHKNPGEFADPNEALQLLVERHPQKDTILRAADAGGSGRSNGGNRGGTRTMKRADFDGLDAVAKQNAVASMGKGEMTIVD